MAKPKIQSITIYSAKGLEKDKLSQPYKSTYKSFDEHQRLIEETIFYVDGAVDSARFYTYDSEGNKIAERRVSNHGTLEEKSQFQYNEEGQLVNREIIYSDGSKSRQKYNLQGKGNYTMQQTDENGILELKETKDVGELTKKFIEEYNKEGVLLKREELTFTLTGKLSVRVIIQFDEQGNEAEKLFEENFYNKEDALQSHRLKNERGAVIFRTEYKYDKNHKVKTEKVEDYRGMLSLYTTTYDYNEKGQKVKLESISRQAEVLARRFFEYNSEGYLSIEKIFESGDPFQLEPGLVVRSNTNFQTLKYLYTYYEEAPVSI